MDDQPDDSFEPVPELLPALPVSVTQVAPAPGSSLVVTPGGEKSAASQPHHSWFYRLLNFLLGANTPVGRIMRPALRWTALLLSLFALGLMAGYFLLYHPVQQAWVAGQQDNAALNGQISHLQDQVSGLQDQIKSLQDQVSTANLSVVAAQNALAKAQARNELLRVTFDIANARADLAKKDGATLIDTLKKARVDLDVVLPYLQSAKKDLADELNSRLETVSSVVGRDASLAQSDLDNLFTALISADTLLFGTNP